MIDSIAEHIGPTDNRIRYDDYEMGRWHRADVRRYASVEEWDDGDVLLILDDRSRESASRVQPFESAIARGWPASEQLADAIETFLETGTIIELVEPPKPSDERGPAPSWIRRLISQFVGE